MNRRTSNFSTFILQLFGELETISNVPAETIRILSGKECFSDELVCSEPRLRDTFDGVLRKNLVYFCKSTLVLFSEATTTKRERIVR